MGPWVVQGECEPPILQLLYYLGRVEKEPGLEFRWQTG